MPRETDAKRRSDKMKFLCNYGGRILPRISDGELRYVGGLTRVLAVDRSVSYSELMANLAEFCGFAATLRCQLPEGDLETLVSVKSDEELANLIEAYDEKASKESPSPAPALKIIAVLTPQAKDGTGISSPVPSIVSGSDVSPYNSSRYWHRLSRKNCSPAAGPWSPTGLWNGTGKLHCRHGYPEMLPRVPCSPHQVYCNICQLSSAHHHRIWTN
ncbi:hypothetical protein SAY87_010658 [Trapa incisa]|uniref:PB1 domain-containing protein n=1 Tax=Trapa incisa TaxID=236973 RepID=A0AAN7GI40_9MYRT|nr:hypothetical protein SAY87_010658 [Trapa incisa]